jgi:hypothetical protein
LDWHLKPKPDLQALEEHIEANNLNREDYPVLMNQPKLFPDLLWVWEGFHKLSACRQRGFGSIQPLDMTAIQAFMNGKSTFDAQDREDFLMYVLHLDGILVATIDARQPKPGKK